WYTYARRRRALDDPESVGRTAAARALRRLGARKVKTTEVPVIFDPDTAASLLRSIAGAASGPSLYRRASFLLERLGTRIAAPSVTIVDDGLLPGALGSRPFDGEGLATRRTVLVGEGKLESYLLDSYSARKLGLASTHHASRDGAGVSVGTTNLMLRPGTTSPQDLIGSVKSGFYVTELIGFGVNGVTGDYSRGAAGMWIEDGRLAFPVEEVTVAGNLLEMFDRIEGIGNDLVLRDRVAAPTLKIARMVVAGDYMVIDSHCHLHDPALPDALDPLRVAQSLDVWGVIAVGCDAETNARNLALAAAAPKAVWACLGFHPDQDRLGDADLDAVEQQVAEHHARIVGLGEVGLPWYSLEGNADAAERAARGRERLDRLLALAARYDLAVSLHAPHGAAADA